MLHPVRSLLVPFSFQCDEKSLYIFVSLSLSLSIITRMCWNIEKKVPLLDMNTHIYKIRHMPEEIIWYVRLGKSNKHYYHAACRIVTSKQFQCVHNWKRRIIRTIFESIIWSVSCIVCRVVKYNLNTISDKVKLWFVYSILSSVYYTIGYCFF